MLTEERSLVPSSAGWNLSDTIRNPSQAMGVWVIALLLKPVRMAWMHKYKGINKWTFIWIVYTCLLFPKSDNALRVLLLLFVIVCWWCYRIYQNNKASSKKIEMILVRLVFLRGLYFFMLSFTGVDSQWPNEKRRQTRVRSMITRARMIQEIFTALASQLVLWGHSISGKVGWDDWYYCDVLSSGVNFVSCWRFLFIDLVFIPSTSYLSSDWDVENKLAASCQ